ncbi:hypothetical protein [Nocardioides sp. Soil796]|uniref:hypothetical protein n=1 Tax=Nocardioides sp. Soil796 TaxID=1736412 RepID=UPI000AA63C1B|nr:hypothetical protein [Nocardioides sp. Soil796]
MESAEYEALRFLARHPELQSPKSHERRTAEFLTELGYDGFKIMGLRLVSENKNEDQPA